MKPSATLVNKAGVLAQPHQNFHLKPSTADYMARVDTLRTEIARLEKKEAELYRQLARHQEEGEKRQREAGTKAAAALKSKSPSLARSYSNAADLASKSALKALQKVAEFKGKIADGQKAIAAKKNALRGAEDLERKAEQRSKASEQRIAERARELERKKDLAHARTMARIATPIRHIMIQPPKPEILRVLYLTANPERTETTIKNPDGSVAEYGSWLRTEAEVRGVQKEIRGALHRDAVELSHMPAATHQDMLDGLNDKRPHVIHFSGHGGGRGLLFDNGSPSKPEGVDVSYDNLGSFLAATDHPPRLLVLNACDTLDGAETLLPIVPVIIAMSDTISDSAAAIFASRFYAAIASGQSVGSALKQSKATLKMLYNSEGHLPQCIHRDNVNIDHLILVSDPT